MHSPAGAAFDLGFDGSSPLAFAVGFDAGGVAALALGLAILRDALHTPAFTRDVPSGWSAGERGRAVEDEVHVGHLARVQLELLIVRRRAVEGVSQLRHLARGHRRCTGRRRWRTRRCLRGRPQLVSHPPMSSLKANWREEVREVADARDVPARDVTILLLRHVGSATHLSAASLERRVSQLRLRCEDARRERAPRPPVRRLRCARLDARGERARARRVRRSEERRRCSVYGSDGSSARAACPPRHGRRGASADAG